MGDAFLSILDDQDIHNKQPNSSEQRHNHLVGADQNSDYQRYEVGPENVQIAEEAEPIPQALGKPRKIHIQSTFYLSIIYNSLQSGASQMDAYMNSDAILGH